MLSYGIFIKLLVNAKQLYIASLSRIYKLHSVQALSQLDSWLCGLDMRIFAVETVYRSAGSKSPGIDNEILMKDDLLSYTDRIDRARLKCYKSSSIRNMFIPKGNCNSEQRSLGIPTIYDRIVQTLFLQLLDPLIDIFSDNNSYGFRKGRNAHQAIGKIARQLYFTPSGGNRESVDLRKNKQYVLNQKYIVKVDIREFFESVDHQWILNNFPFPKSFSYVLKS